MSNLFKSAALAAILSIISMQAQAFTSEIKTVTLPDGETATVRLCLPENEDVPFDTPPKSF